MVRTNDKKIREAMQRHVLSFYKGEGGRTALVDQLDRLIDRRADARRYATPKTPYQAGAEMAKGGCFLVYINDVDRFLARIGLEDKVMYGGVRNEFGDGVWALYVALCAKACEEIYDDYMKKHPSALRTARGY